MSLFFFLKELLTLSVKISPLGNAFLTEEIQEIRKDLLRYDKYLTKKKEEYFSIC
jgi:hypothetical protein